MALHGRQIPVADGVVRHVRGTTNLHQDSPPPYRHSEVFGNQMPHIYIDDLLIIDQCPLRAARAMGLTMQLLQTEVGL